jgi:hypothetical protein
MDADLGRYLLSDASFGDREDMAQRLWSAGADPVDVDALERQWRAVRRRRGLAGQRGS